MDKNIWLKECKECLIKGESIFINDDITLSRDDLNYQFFIRSSEEENLHLSIDELLDLTVEEFIEPYYLKFVNYYNEQLKLDEAISAYELSKTAA